MREFPDRIRKLYIRNWGEFGFRILMCICVFVVSFRFPDELSMLEGMNFFQHFSFLHILWGLWVWYMLEKLIPIGNQLPIGAAKYRKNRFQPTKEYECYQMNPEEAASCNFKCSVQEERKWYAKGAWIVFTAWMIVTLVIGILKHWHILGNRELLLLSTLFYVGDMVCILIWCPFRDVLMKNRCCTQCRIYNWDTMMLILPLVFIRGFFSYSLLIGAILVVSIWEISHLLHPERFYPITNANLQCGTCKGEMGCYLIRQKRKQSKRNKKV